MSSGLQTWKRMMGYLKPYTRWVALALIGALGLNLLGIAIPFILERVIDIGIANGDAAFMIAAGGLVILLGVLRGVSGFFSRYFGERLSHFIAYDIRNEVYDKVQGLPSTYHDNAHVGTMITRAISDVNEIQRYFAFGLLDTLNLSLLIGGVAVVMFLTNPLLAFIAFVPIFVLGFLSTRFASEVGPRWGQIMERIQTLSNHIQENALGHEVVRVFAREDHEIETFGRQNERLYEEQLSFINLWASFLPTSAFLAAASTALTLFFGGLFATQGFGGITVGTVVAFNAYVFMIANPVRFMGFVILLTTQGIASAQRAFEILDEPNAMPNDPDAFKLPEIKGRVKFERVGFAYDGGETVLQDISLEAKPGQVIAVVGATGSGKTTLVQLIPRYYDVTSGRILIDGHDIRHVELHSLRRQIGIVQQRTLLFSATIHENIAYGRPDASREEVIEAAKAANAHDFIMSFPKGYDTLVGERGVTLSGGQRQRTAIARAILIDPRILILDDSTSSVDTQTEFLIQQALERIMVGRVSFVVAQRLSTVLNADLILVLDKGRIVERGTHERLLQQGGLYRDIYRLQLEEQDRARREASFEGTLRPLKQRKDKHDDKRATEEYRGIIDRVGGD
jgi:ATP-binding cassette, subfamily B, multidrug efflux pump